MKPTLLIIDNAQAVLRTLAVSLAPYFEVKHASGALEALYAMTCELPDAILLEVVMPALSGLDLARLLRSNPCSATIPIVLTSGDRGNLVDYRKVGAQSALVKPIRVEGFVDIVQNLLALPPQEGTMADAEGGGSSTSLIVLSSKGKEATLVGDAPWGVADTLSLRYAIDGDCFTAKALISNRRNTFFDVILSDIQREQRTKNFRWAKEVGIRYRAAGDFARLAKTKLVAGNAIWVAGMPPLKPATRLEIQVLLDGRMMPFRGSIEGSEEQEGQSLTRIALEPPAPELRDPWTLFLFRGATSTQTA